MTLPNKILFKRGSAATIPFLSIGEPGFATDTHSLYVGSDVGNVNVASSFAQLGFSVEDLSGQVSNGATTFTLADVTGSILVMLDGKLLNPGGVMLSESGLFVELIEGVEDGDQLVAIRASSPF